VDATKLHAAGNQRKNKMHPEHMCDHLGQSGSEQSQTLIATHLVGRRNQLLLTSHPWTRGADTSL
jgi:hypothetical protein